MKRKDFCNPIPKRTSSCTIPGLATFAPQGFPELSIYSQQKVYRKGEIPIWDNPDITTYRGSAEPIILPVDNVTARVTNLSSLAPAINTKVHCDIAPIGIGTEKIRLMTHQLTIPKSASAILSFPLSSSWVDSIPPAAYITVEHITDPTLINNIGAQVTHGVYTSRVGTDMEFVFPVENNTLETHYIELIVQHNNLNGSVEPPEFQLLPGRTQQVKLSCSVTNGSDSFKRENVTVMATNSSDNQLIGGITYFAIIDD